MTRGPTAFERLGQAGRLLRSEGHAGVARRLRTRAANVASPHDDWRLRVARADLLGAAEIARQGWILPPPLPAKDDEPLTVAWLCVPPGPGAGGFTTLFRIVGALERAGHNCIVYLHDRHGWTLDQHRRTIREWWPWLGAEIRDAAGGISNAHAVFATSWETAYPVLASPAKGSRFYLVQDFEPSFYPAGSEALLAEATYHFGFYGVTAGRWLSELLSREYGMSADHFDFGCDLDRYFLDAAAARTGVCLYARPDTPRRAFELGVAALDVFAERHPEVEIHLFGNPTPKLPFPVTAHGRITPAELNRLYNRCIGGLVLSATNVSLVPLEMLGAGCIPVVNDAPHNRLVLDNDEVVYAAPTPFELANALSALVEQPRDHQRANIKAAVASVAGASWDEAGAVVERIVREVIRVRSERPTPEHACA